MILRRGYDEETNKKATAPEKVKDSARGPAGETNKAVSRILNRKKEVISMPGFDRSGPMGAGPMTGGARGLCNPANAGTPRPFQGRGFFGRGFGRGYGMAGRGRGAGRGAMGYPPAAAYGPPAGTEDELKWLADQSNYLKSELDRINGRIDELKSEPSK